VADSSDVIEVAPRPLTGQEHALLATLLGADFPGRETLTEQLAQAHARRVDTEGSLELSVSGGSAADVVRRIPVEAELEDIDGVTIHVLLHVVRGFLNELEFFREDGGLIQGPIEADKLRILVL
jgi:hypothetical protein